MIKPHGGGRLVSRYMTREELEQTIHSAAGMPSLTLDDFMLTECQRIADGSFTPVEGFCTKAEMDAIVKESKLLSGVLFPIPLFLQIPQSLYGDGQTHGGALPDVLLKDEAGNAIGIIEKPTCFAYDLGVLSRFIFGTANQQHPGVAKLFSKGNLFIGGKVKVRKITDGLSAYCLSPAETRAAIAERKWGTCVGFQTRNVPHLAHEYLQKTVMELFDGLLIHPVIGWKKKEDYTPEVVMDVYRYLTENVYPQGKALLSGLQIQMRYAGPKEAVLHAIIRQNYGCTHFIVGRDHAGVGGYYGRYEAHELVEKMQDKLAIQILRMRGPQYCDKCESIVTDNVCAHDESSRREVSGTIIRERILAGQYPPKEFIRQEIAERIMRHEKIFLD